MLFAVLLYANEAEHESRDAETAARAGAAHIAFQGPLREKGALGPGALLAGDKNAVHIRTRNGEEKVAQGPAVHLDESLHGVYLIEATSLEEAIAAARALPHDLVTVEIRPVVRMAPDPSF